MQDEELVLELRENNSQRLACVLVLDCSSSMADQNRIAFLNNGIKVLEEELKKDPMAKRRVQIALVRCGGGVHVESMWTDAVNFSAPVLEASGDTPLGRASLEGLRLIEEQIGRYKQNGIPYNRPWLFIMTDGGPNDPHWQESARLVREAAAAKKVIVYPIGVKGADLAALSQFQKPGDEVWEIEGVNFGELFKWLSRSASTASVTAPGAPLQQEMPPATRTITA